METSIIFLKWKVNMKINNHVFKKTLTCVLLRMVSPVISGTHHRMKQVLPVRLEECAGT